MHAGRSSWDTVVIEGHPIRIVDVSAHTPGCLCRPCRGHRAVLRAEAELPCWRGCSRQVTMYASKVAWLRGCPSCSARRVLVEGRR